MERARGWIEDGDKVRATIAFRGREMTHRELGAAILKRLEDDLKDIADVEVRPKMEGYQMFSIFIPKKSNVEKKPSQTEKKEE
jgi:translation initiation factor IF-3